MVFNGDQLVVLVETAVAGVFVEISDLHQVQVQTTRDRNRYPVFQAAAHVLLARAARAVSLQGYLNATDEGQQRLRAMEDSETPVKIRVLPDGIAGLEMIVLVHSKTYAATSEEGTLQPVSYECEATAIPVTVGAGILI